MTIEKLRDVVIREAENAVELVMRIYTGDRANFMYAKGKATAYIDVLMKIGDDECFKCVSKLLGIIDELESALDEQ